MTATVGPQSVVAVLAAFRPVATIALAATVLRERIDAVQRVGVVAVTAA